MDIELFIFLCAVVSIPVALLAVLGFIRGAAWLMYHFNL